MKTISNRTGQPVRVPLGGGKLLHLGPHKTGQVSDEKAKAPKVRSMIESGIIEIVGEDGPAAGSSTGGTNAHGEATHGHPQPSRIQPKGNR